MSQRIAVVSGANRGLGLEITRQLAGAGLRVVMTARDEAKGRATWEKLAAEGLDLDFHLLDVTSDDSVATLATYMSARHGGVDVLVNNAGILPGQRGAAARDIFTAPMADLFAAMDANAFGAFRLGRALLPMMRQGGYGRIVNMSSGMGQLSDMDGGYPAYRLSKTAMNAVTRILAAEVRGENILVNSMCPGWVHTDMGGPNAPRTPAEGADTALWLATLPDGGPSGGFFRDRAPIPW